MKLYTRRSRHLPTEFDVFHYRSGFGGAALKSARAAHATLLCDQSLLHPEALGSAIGSRWSASEVEFWRLVEADLKAADAVVANSELVADSCRKHLRPPLGIHVIRLPVSDAFTRPTLRARHQRGPGEPLRLFYAGSLERRKGIDTLAKLILKRSDARWQLACAGPIRGGHQSVTQLLGDPRVTYLGVLPQHDLAQALLLADVFVFPTRAEGAARVVTEAMAMGCYIITTPMAGSPVVDREHGRVIPAGDEAALDQALDEISTNRQHMFNVGMTNADFVRKAFTKTAYRNELMRLYNDVRGGQAQ